MKKGALVMSGVLLLSLVFSGCGLLNKVKEDFNKGDGVAKQNDFNNPTVLIDTSEQLPTVTNETKLITLYFTDSVDNKLVAEQREIPKVMGIARATMEELIKGPTEPSLKATLPANTKLLDINIREDGLAIVDFSGDLIKELPVTSTA